MKGSTGLIVFVGLILIISCNEVTVNPSTVTVVADTVFVDRDVEKFAEFMTTDWKCTKLAFTAPPTWTETAGINCTAENQYAILKELRISRTNRYNQLKVVNTYYCNNSQTITYFQLAKIACCGFTVTEVDGTNQVLRVFDFILNGKSTWSDVFLQTKSDDHVGISLFSRTFDPTMFDLQKPGSLSALPSVYVIFIEKNL
jgi:hypothetical protein